MLPSSEYVCQLSWILIKYFHFPDTKPHAPVQHDDKISLKKVLDLVNKNDDQGLKDMNKKLQNMLEETLTKNMHLQKVSTCIP